MARKKIKNSVNRILFGKKIKSARENMGLTQFALADHIDVSPNFLGDVERGKKLPSIEVLIDLCNFLKLSLDSVFSDSLNIYISEDDTTIYSDKQLSIIKNVIKVVTDNFNN